MRPPARRATRRGVLRAALAGLAGVSLARVRLVGATSDPEEPTAGPPEAGGPAEPLPWGVPPISLAIPGLGVDARVVPVTLDEDGAMAAPPNPDDVAWYSLGPGMGVGGNVIFAGHIDWDGRLRVFGRLASLRPDDAILVVDATGNGYQYLVESIHWVRAEGAPVEQIFAQDHGSSITLITCGGEYRPETREYLDRLIVRARGT